jgi:hypothetical protein
VFAPNMRSLYIILDACSLPSADDAAGKGTPLPWCRQDKTALVAIAEAALAADERFNTGTGPDTRRLISYMSKSLGHEARKFDLGPGSLKQQKQLKGACVSVAVCILLLLHKTERLGIMCTCAQLEEAGLKEEVEKEEGGGGNNAEKPVDDAEVSVPPQVQHKRRI